MVLHHGHLLDVVKKIFPQTNTFTNVRKPANLVSPLSGLFLELDIWIPDKKIAFEYQDAYHYITKWDSNLPLNKIQKQDELKRQLMEERGETLITVPCWWDGSLASLVGTIRLSRPELVSNYSLPINLPSPPPSVSLSTCIPVEPPQGFFRVKSIPGIGELMLPSFVSSSNFNPTNWWMSEKYDGIRAYWNPDHTSLFTRHGGKWNILYQLLPFFPKSDPLDGEIWCGKETMLGVKENTIVWHSLRYMAFDKVTPSILFEDRFTQVLTSIDKGNYFVIPVSNTKCNSKSHLELAVKAILDHGGEGVIVRAPRSKYQHGRSDLLHKLKAHKRDYEALVVEVQPTCLSLKLPTGLIFSVNKSEVLIATGAGDIVTFSYGYFSYSGKPVDPKILKVRSDLEWADVLTNYYSSEQDINVMGDRAIKESDRRAAGYWTTEDKGQQRMRAFFDQLARDHALDPSLPESWYPFTEEIVTAAQGGSILYHFQGSIIRALLNVYPDIGLDPSKFTRRYWHILANRKRVFDKFAARNQFDPSIPDNWYHFTKHDIPLKKVAPYLLTYYYGKSLYDILVDIYPQASFKEGYFKFCTGTYWKDITNRKDFFDDFAKKNGFDSLVAENWYKVKNEAVLSNPGGTAVLHQFGNSVAKALKFTYTQVTFDASKFQFLSKKYWLDSNNRRRFFDSYAEKYGFNPLIPDNWYSLSSHSILSEKGGSSVLGYSGRSLVKSLQDAYPELEFNVLKFAVLPRSYWSSFANRKKFFDSLAKKHMLDPLNESQWTRINNSQVIMEKGGSSLLKHYNGSLRDAVKDVYQFGIV